MAQRVGIVAVAQTKFEEKPGQHIGELLYQTSRDVMKQTGLEFKDDGTGIDCTVASGYDLMSGPGGAYSSSGT